jgi:hypothetical protein
MAEPSMQPPDKDKLLADPSIGWSPRAFGLEAGVLGSVPEPDTLSLLGIIAKPEHLASVTDEDEDDTSPGARVPGLDEFIQDQLDP